MVNKKSVKQGVTAKKGAGKGTRSRQKKVKENMVELSSADREKAKNLQGKVKTSSKKYKGKNAPRLYDKELSGKANIGGNDCSVVTSCVPKTKVIVVDRHGRPLKGGKVILRRAAEKGVMPRSE